MFAHPFAGQIAEVLVYNSSQSEMRELTFAYLNEKYNLNLGLQPLEKSMDTEWELYTEESITDTHNAEFGIYPNPAATQAAIVFPTNIEGNISIHDVMGTTVGEYTLKNSNRLSLDITTLPTGTYTVHVQSGGKSMVQPLVIVR